MTLEGTMLFKDCTSLRPPSSGNGTRHPREKGLNPQNSRLYSRHCCTSGTAAPQLRPWQGQHKWLHRLTSSHIEDTNTKAAVAKPSPTAECSSAGAMLPGAVLEQPRLCCAQAVLNGLLILRRSGPTVHAAKSSVRAASWASRCETRR